MNTLGVEDYGIYNVVGGFVAFFSFLNGAMATATQRFITFELAKGNINRQMTTFSTAAIIHFVIGLIIVVVAETIGLWFVCNKMVIPEERFSAAIWVYQFSILTMFISIVSIPYNAAIIAHEKMSAFAYISILDVVLKLVIVLLLTIVTFDKLIFYAAMLLGISLLDRMIYGIYCKRHFAEAHIKLIFDKNLFREMTNIAGWSLFGNIAGVFYTQGLNVLLNMFFGPAVNAARGIAYQVNSAINGFVNNFMMALNPQITKSYASGNREYMMTLIYQGARLSFYILMMLSLPVIINVDYILELWLKTVPEHTSTFIQLVLIFTMSEAISNPLITAMLATGRIKNYQIVVGGLQLLNLPISYILLKNGCIPETVLIVAICISQCCLATRLYMLRGMIELSSKIFLNKVY